MHSQLYLSALALAGALTSQALTITLNASPGLFDGAVNGRAVVMFSPPGANPLDDTDDVTSKNHIFGKDVTQFTVGDSITFAATYDGDYNGVIGWPNISLAELPLGKYRVQAYVTRYESVTRSDGSKSWLRFPCGDGAPQIDAPGSLISSIIDVEYNTVDQNIQLTYNAIEPKLVFSGTEIGGCYQGNYADVGLQKYVKIRSEVLSNFWNRDMYVGANVLLPASYNQSETQRYPVLYSQSHWPGYGGAFSYPDADWSSDWDRGVRGDTGGLAPQLIMVTFRHEAPYYDDSYGVNTANLGPWGDAINDELIPHLESLFRTIPQPYARIQEGGSTGGWISAASVIFRPDLFGYCFSSYPDSLDFHRHQDIHLYDEASAYFHADGSSVPSIRAIQPDGTDKVLVSTQSENRWELSFGSRSRSDLQWDVWNAVFGAQGYNGYPLEPWNKVTGEIFPQAVEYWKDMDLAKHIVDNWDNSLNLGQNLKHRVFVYVGSADTYYLNEGVQAFQATVSAKGGPDWANITIFANKEHGGTYQLRPFWSYLDFIQTWVHDHGPNGTSPLDPALTTAAGRGNKWADIQQKKGWQSAVARQTDPKVLNQDVATVGSWDPGMNLTAQWQDASQQNATSPFTVDQCSLISVPRSSSGAAVKGWKLLVTGVKNGYVTETRSSNAS